MFLQDDMEGLSSSATDFYGWTLSHQTQTVLRQLVIECNEALAGN